FGPGMPLAMQATRGQHHRKLRIGLFFRWKIWPREKPSLSAGCRERTIGVSAPCRASQRRRGPLGGTALCQPFMRQRALVVGPAARRSGELVEDLGGIAKLQARLKSHFMRDLLRPPPIRPCIGWGL